MARPATSRRLTAFGPDSVSPKMYTTWHGSRVAGAILACGLLVSGGLGAALSGTAAWVLVAAVWVVLLPTVWLRVLRYCHPIRQFRYEWTGYRGGLFTSSAQSVPAWIRAWEATGGKPPRHPAEDPPARAVAR